MEGNKQNNYIIQDKQLFPTRKIKKRTGTFNYVVINFRSLIYTLMFT